MVNRLMARASLSIKPAPHMGMALSLYTNGTSPLRKALDYCVHLQLKAMLGDTSVEPASATVFDLLNQASAKNRQAVNGAHNWLTCNFLNAQAAADTSQFDGEIVHINTSGFTVKLDDLGLEGVVDLRKDSEKFSFDKWEMALTSPSKRYQLRQRVRVQYVTNERPPRRTSCIYGTGYSALSVTPMTVSFTASQHVLGSNNNVQHLSGKKPLSR